MFYFSKLFIKAPFQQLRRHIKQVRYCLDLLEEIFSKLEDNPEDLHKLSTQLSKHEHEADIIKNEIRTYLPPKLIGIDRANFLEILRLQDNLADISEEIASYLIIKPLANQKLLHEKLKHYLQKNIEAAQIACDVGTKYTALVEASFGGRVAREIKDKINQATTKEHKSDLLKKEVLKILFNQGDTLSTPDFYLWARITENIGNISHIAEKLTLRIGNLLNK